MPAGRTRTALDLDEALRGGDPIDREALRELPLADAFDVIASSIVSLPHPGPAASRPPRRRLVLLVAAIVVALGATAAASAVLLGAHTGLFPDKAQQAIGGPGEALNPAASDFRSVALQQPL